MHIKMATAMAVATLLAGGALTASPAFAASSTSTGTTGPIGLRHVTDLTAKNRSTPPALRDEVGPRDVQTLNGFGGYGQWNPNPSGSIPGDSIKACDTAADGWGIETWLDSNRDGTIDRIATTRGHDSPYCSAWESGNLPENTYVDVYVVQVKGDDLGEYAEYEVYTS